MWRVSKKWLIVEAMYVKPLRHFGRTKSALKKLFGTKLVKYDLDKEILSTGWEEYARVRVKHSKHWVGVYKKLPSLGNRADCIPYS